MVDNWTNKTRCLIAETRCMAESTIDILEMDKEIWAPRSYMDGGTGKKWDKICLVWPRKEYLDLSSLRKDSFIRWVDCVLRTKTDNFKIIG